MPAADANRRPATETHGFARLLATYDAFDFDACLGSVTADQVAAIIRSDRLTPRDFLALLSDAAEPHLEAIARRAHQLTRQHFGNVIFLFTPLYISNYCRNRCLYCAFAGQHRIRRRHLEPDAIANEARRIAEQGIRHILILTGEDPERATVQYLETAIRVITRHFSAVGIEVYPMDEADYGRLIDAGVDSLTIYQETYHRSLYAELHAGGPKADFNYRLEAPERACRRHIRQVNVGALLGLRPFHTDAFFAALHADYLQRRFPAVEVGISFPRLRPSAGGYQPHNPVDDRRFVQLITAFRLFMPRAAITISTREAAAFRDALLPLGVTRMSAGVSTAVGAHSDDPSTDQFDIADTRTVAQMQNDLTKKGYQPVMHDWNTRYLQ